MSYELRESNLGNIIESEIQFTMTPTATPGDARPAAIDQPGNATAKPRKEAVITCSGNLRSTSVPQPFRGHPRINGRFFFTLPADLWEAIIEVVGREAFDTGALEMERVLSDISGDHSTRVGFWRNTPVYYDHLERKPINKISEEKYGREWGKNQAEIDSVVRSCEGPLARFHGIAQAYAGWLLTNRQFIEEHDAILSRWADFVARRGTDCLQHPEQMPEIFDFVRDPDWPSARADFEKFFVRWCLKGIAAPYLPSPIKPQLSTALPTSTLERLRRTGHHFYIPDTYPIPSRDELWNLLENAFHRDASEHLEEWSSMVAGNNMAKKSLGKYARLFQLQHFWHVLYSRHAQSLCWQKGKLETVFAKFLDVSKETVHRNLLCIEDKLGKDWLERGKDFPFGPF